jgi:hypothetical protein
MATRAIQLIGRSRRPQLSETSSTSVEVASALNPRLEEAIYCAMNPHHGAPFHHGDNYFHFHNSSLQARIFLCVQVNHQLKS